MADAETVLLELAPHEVMTLRDALVYFAEFASDDLHQGKAKRAADLRFKLLQSLIADTPAPVLRAAAG